MQIFSSANSPFGARVTIAARAKEIELESLKIPSGGLRADAFLATNPIAKIPVVITGDGLIIPESSVILHYLEDRFPDPSLLPSNAEERAKINIAMTIVDRYVMDPVIRLFAQLNPSSRDQGIVDYELERWNSGLSHLEHFLNLPLPKVAAPVNMADCVLPPSLHLGTRIAAMLGLDDDPLQSHPKLLQYYEWAKADPLIGVVLDELTEFQATTDVAAGRPSLAHLHWDRQQSITSPHQKTQGKE